MYFDYLYLVIFQTPLKYFRICYCSHPFDYPSSYHGYTFSETVFLGKHVTLWFSWFLIFCTEWNISTQPILAIFQCIVTCHSIFLSLCSQNNQYDWDCFRSSDDRTRSFSAHRTVSLSLSSSASPPVENANHFLAEWGIQSGWCCNFSSRSQKITVSP